MRPALAADTFDVGLVATIAECDAQVARAALALQEHGAPASARAHHVERSASPGDQAAITILLEAASATMTTTPASAAHWLEVALRLLSEADSTLALRLDLLGRRAKALGVTGRLAESRDVLHEVLTLLPAYPAEQRAQVVGFCALMDRLLGRHAEARALLLGELNRLGECDTAATAMLKLELAAGRLMHGDFSTDQDCAQEAVVIARRLDDRCLLAAALGMCALNDLSDASIVERSFSWVAESAELVDALPDGELARHLMAAVHLGWAEMHLERIDDALRHLDRGLRLARASGQNHILTYLLLGYGTTLGLSGRLREAGDCFDDALEASGRRERARRMLTRARALFDACGAGLFQARALREERRLNARAPRQSQRSGQLGGLTRREAELASLVTAGLTNRQIAQRLYLSPRTVEVHLSRILAKLDVTTRSAIAPAMIKASPRPAAGYPADTDLGGTA